MIVKKLEVMYVGHQDTEHQGIKDSVISVYKAKYSFDIHRIDIGKHGKRQQGRQSGVGSYLKVKLDPLEQGLQHQRPAENGGCREIDPGKGDAHCRHKQ